MKQLTCNVGIISLIGIFGLEITGTDASCVLYIICLHFITFSKSCSVLPIAFGLLNCWHHLMPFCFALALICFWLNVIFQFTSAFSLSCTREFELVTRGFELVTRAFELVTRVFELVTGGFELAAHKFELVTRKFELVTREFELVTREFELVTRGFELVTRGFELALLNFNSCF